MPTKGQVSKKKQTDMLSCRITKNGFGYPDIAEYTNGFTFEGTFNEKNDPILGVIKDPEGNIVFEGRLKFDIYQYFQTYLKTGQQIKSNI